MSADIIAFNPLDDKNLAASIAEALLSRRTHPLGDLPEFLGAGVYTIYYSGDFPPYEELAKRNRNGIATAPIYIGKAVPPGSRKGAELVTEVLGKDLFNRLCEHADSIRAASNLRIEHFSCRFLVVKGVYIPLGEALLIARYSPLWNFLVDGFGNHDPGAGRYKGKRPRWDVLHPGRAWAMKCAERPETQQEIARDAETYLRNATYPTSDRFIIPPE